MINLLYTTIIALSLFTFIPDKAYLYIALDQMQYNGTSRPFESNVPIILLDNEGWSKTVYTDLHGIVGFYIDSSKTYQFVINGRGICDSTTFDPQVPDPDFSITCDNTATIYLPQTERE